MLMLIVMIVALFMFSAMFALSIKQMGKERVKGIWIVMLMNSLVGWIFCLVYLAQKLGLG
jgi:uncharacterized membrane protein